MSRPIAGATDLRELLARDVGADALRGVRADAGREAPAVADIASSADPLAALVWQVVAIQRQCDALLAQLACLTGSVARPPEPEPEGPLARMPSQDARPAVFGLRRDEDDAPPR